MHSLRHSVGSVDFRNNTRQSAIYTTLTALCLLFIPRHIYCHILEANMVKLYIVIVESHNGQLGIIGEVEFRHCTHLDFGHLHVKELVDRQSLKLIEKGSRLICQSRPRGKCCQPNLLCGERLVVPQ